MFTIVYDKITGNISNIINDSDSDNLKNALPATSDFIFVEKLPALKPYREKLCVKNNILTIESIISSEYDEFSARNMEICDEIQNFKDFLILTDYQAIKFAEGELSKIDYTPIKEKRRQARLKINQLEAELEIVNSKLKSK